MADVLTVDPSRPVDPSRVPDILRRTAPWVTLMAVILFISCGLMVVGGLVFAVGLAAGLAAGGSGRLGAAPALVAGLVYVCFGLINLAPAVFLMRFASRSKAFVASPRPELLEQALDAQRSYWKFMGIFVLVAVVLTICVFFIALIAGVWFMRAAPR